jgi:hypothetical protein
MFAKILKWLLKLVDVEIRLEKDILYIVLSLGSVKVLNLAIDLIKDGNLESYDDPESPIDVLRARVSAKGN